ncbi:MAG: hypothetical protein DMG29_09515 [Acidobacteria bacterium]|nr:MAG: hypothetical protein DMG29_09515 [Acidobacteriota bacterium]
MARVSSTPVAVLMVLLATAVWLAASLWSGTVGAAPPPRLSGSLTGIVLSAGGKGVAGARVILQVADGSHPHTTQSDAKGHFRFPALRQGNYDLRAQAQGQWSEWEHNVLVRSGRETRVTLRLPLKQRQADPPRVPGANPAKAPPRASP